MTNLINFDAYRPRPSQQQMSVNDADMIAAHAMLDDEASPMSTRDIVTTANQLIGWAADQITSLLATVSYDDLVSISNQCSDRGLGADLHFLNEIVSDEFGRRHQQMDPENYPTSDGAA